MATSRRLWILKILALLLSMLGMLMSGTIYAFNAYSNALKATFNYTQTEVSNIISAGNIGICAGFPAGIVIMYFGAFGANLVSMTVPTAGYLLMWAASTYWIDFFQSNAWLFTLIYFFAGHGSIYIYMSGLLTTMKNFPAEHRGAVVGLLDAMYGVSAAIFSLIYSQQFVNGHQSDHEELQDIGGFFILIACGFGVIGFFALFGLREYQDSNEIGVTETKDDLEPTESKDITGLQLLKRWEFHCLVWPFFLAGGAGLTIASNVTVILKSFDMEDYSTQFTIMIPVASALSRFACGILSDLTKKWLPRPSYIFITSLVFLIAIFAGIFAVDSIYLLNFLCLFEGISYGALWCVTPTVMSELFGLKYFGLNWGFTILGSALVALGTQAIFGAIYDSYSVGLYCNGLKCFQTSLIIFAVITLLSVIITSVICVKMKRQYRNNK